MKLIKYFNISLFVLLISACGGGDGSSDDGPEQPEIPEVVAPSASTLIFPDNNEECNEGIINSNDETKSTVTFQWNASQNTDSYEVNLKNLNTDETSVSTATTNERAITLDRGTPYEWFVVSKANGTNETATSPNWVFYNQGAGIENYAPFPATAVNPLRGSTVVTNTTTITLQWEGNDVDNDIISYEILFGTDLIPVTSLGVISEQLLEVTVATQTTYYWRVITTDSGNNSSNSEIFDFRID